MNDLPFYEFADTSDREDNDVDMTPHDQQEPQAAASTASDSDSNEPTGTEPVEQELSAADRASLARIAALRSNIDTFTPRLEEELPSRIQIQRQRAIIALWRVKASHNQTAASAIAHQHRQQCSILRYASAGVAETLMQKLLSLDDVKGGADVKRERKSLVRRIEVMMAFADRLTARIDALQAIWLPRIDQAVSLIPAPVVSSESAAAAQPINTEDAKPIAMADDKGEHSPRAATVTPSPAPMDVAEDEDDAEDEETLPASASPSPIADQSATSSSSAAPQRPATPPKAQSSQPPVDTEARAAFLRFKRSLPEVELPMREHETQSALQLRFVLPEPVSQKFLFVDVNKESHQLTVSGVQFETQYRRVRPARRSPWGGFFENDGVEEVQVPIAWFEQTFTIPSSLSLENMTRFIEPAGSIRGQSHAVLVLSLPKVQQPKMRPRVPKPPQAQRQPSHQFPSHYAADPFSSYSAPRRNPFGFGWY